MTITTITSQQLARKTGAAKQAAADGPVFITERGVLTHVLMTIEDYRELAGEAAIPPEPTTRSPGSRHPVDFR